MLSRLAARAAASGKQPNGSYAAFRFFSNDKEKDQSNKTSDKTNHTSHQSKKKPNIPTVQSPNFNMPDGQGENKVVQWDPTFDYEKAYGWKPKPGM